MDSLQWGSCDRLDVTTWAAGREADLPILSGQHRLGLLLTAVQACHGGTWDLPSGTAGAIHIKYIEQHKAALAATFHLSGSSAARGPAKNRVAFPVLARAGP